MNILNLLTKGSQQQRTQAAIHTSHQHETFRRLLQVRLQRHAVERRAIGDANSKAAIERLKTSEYSLFAKIRLRYHIMLSHNKSECNKLLKSLDAKKDADMVRAVFDVSKAEANTFMQKLLKLQQDPKSAQSHSNKRSLVVTPKDTSTANSQPRKRGRKSLCFHCGANGKNYHKFPECKLWLKGDKPSRGSRFAKDLEAGREIPSPDTYGK